MHAGSSPSIHTRTVISNTPSGLDKLASETPFAGRVNKSACVLTVVNNEGRDSAVS